MSTLRVPPGREQRTKYTARELFFLALCCSLLREQPEQVVPASPDDPEDGFALQGSSQKSPLLGTLSLIPRPQVVATHKRATCSAVHSAWGQCIPNKAIMIETIQVRYLFLLVNWTARKLGTRAAALETCPAFGPWTRQVDPASSPDV